MLAKLTANQTKQAHPEIDTSTLEEVVKELMKDKFIDQKDFDKYDLYRLHVL